MKKIFPLITIALTSFLFFVYPTDTLAQGAPPGYYTPTPVPSSSSSSTTKQPSPLKGDCIDTAIGCIPIDQNEFTGFILSWAIGLGGGIAFLLIIVSSFQIMTSQGDPKRLEAGKELLTSAIMGLMLLVFSVFILRLIGVTILDIF